MFGDANQVAWFNGADEVAQLLPEEALTSLDGGGTAQPLPPIEPGQPGHFQWAGMDVWLPLVEHATNSLLHKRALTRNEFDRLAAAERQKAFSVAGLHTREAVQQVQAAVADAVADGTELREFKDRIEAALGASALSPAALENAFRTSLTVAYSAGIDAMAEKPIVRDLFPYEEIVTVRDSRLTSLCATVARSGINGTAVFRADDPVYRRFKGARHFQCRCGRRLLSVRDAAEKGIGEAKVWLRTGVPPAQPAFVEEPRLSPDDLKIFEAFRARLG